MIKPLIIRELKAGFVTWTIFAAIITLYSSVVVAMYEPELGESLRMMAESMPELFAAFGMSDPGLTLLDFISNYLYGFILIVIPIIFIVVMSSRLMGRYIDKGSMAYLLATPNSRTQVFLSQYFVLLTGVLMLVLYASLLITICSKLMFNEMLDLPAFFRMNLGLFCLHAFIASLCFGAASSFNEGKQSIGVGAGCSILFLLIQMLSQVSDKIDFLKYFTPLTLFDVKGLMTQESSAMLGVLALVVLTSLLTIVSGYWFRKRDLPL